ncbi:PREDICTED: uncharacterized protein LOC109242129 [Nicotiana attenuata]|uniref:uncharacterized protein LOC109242129 n=1 Tax=Nicotiana attenuata TaxID=49451 RepID=UPI0009052D72|nr:PREDICTED: uncharacterized protein LOC109242129 [Nicotiana attenuata]
MKFCPRDKAIAAAKNAMRQRSKLQRFWSVWRQIEDLGISLDRKVDREASWPRFHAELLLSGAVQQHDGMVRTRATGQEGKPPAQAARARGRGRGRGRGRDIASTAAGAAPSDPPVVPAQDQVPEVDVPAGPAQAVSVTTTASTSKAGGGTQTPAARTPEQRSTRPAAPAPVPPTPAQPARGRVQLARGGAQLAMGRPRGGGRSGGGQARFYALPARPNAIASDAVWIRSSVGVK